MYKQQLLFFYLTLIIILYLRFEILKLFEMALVRALLLYFFSYYSMGFSIKLELLDYRNSNKTFKEKQTFKFEYFFI